MRPRRVSRTLPSRWSESKDLEADQVLIGIETDRGPWVQALVAAREPAGRDRTAALKTGHSCYEDTAWPPDASRAAA